MPVYSTDVLVGLVHMRPEPDCKHMQHSPKVRVGYVCLNPGSGGRMCDSGGDTDSDIDNDSGGDGDSDIDNGSDGDTDTDSDTNSDSGGDSGSDSDSDSGGDSGSDTDSGGGGGSCSPLNWRLCFPFRGLEGNLSEYDEAAHAYSQQ